jgi:hypothetical protein
MEKAKLTPTHAIHSKKPNTIPLNEKPRNDIFMENIIISRDVIIKNAMLPLLFKDEFFGDTDHLIADGPGSTLLTRMIAVLLAENHVKTPRSAKNSSTLSRNRGQPA